MSICESPPKNVLHHIVLTKIECVYLLSTGDFSCNGVSCFGENVASVGDDGRVNVLNVNQQGALLREYPEADSCVLTSVLFAKVTTPLLTLAYVNSDVTVVTSPFRLSNMRAFD